MKKYEYDKLIKFKNSLYPVKHIEEKLIEESDGKKVERMNNEFEEYGCVPHSYRRIDGEWFRVVENAHDEVDEDKFLKEEENIYFLERLYSLRRIADMATWVKLLTIIIIVRMVLGLLL